MITFTRTALVCAVISAATLTQTSFAQSCIDLSRAKYRVKSLDFSDFSKNASHTNTVRVIISFRQKLSRLNLKLLIPGRIMHKLNLINAVAAEVPAQAIAALAKDPRVRLVELDAPIYALDGTDPAPTEPAPTEPTPPPAPAPQVIPHGIARSGAVDAWNKTTGKGVTVAIIDTGIDATHPDIKDRVVGGRNFSSTDPEAWKDGNGHGTHVSGTVAATNNSEGVVGMAPDASLLAIKVLSDSGSGTYSGVTAGIEYAIGKAQVANMSLGGPSDIQALHEALIKAHNNGLVVAAAAGNSGEEWGNPINYPGAYPEVVSVAAADDKDQRAYFSTFNKFVAIAALGVDVLSCEKDGKYLRHSGTSMATPHIAGATALLRQTFPDETVIDLKRRLVCNADDQWPTGRDNWTGHGIVNVNRALENAAPESCDYNIEKIEEPVIAAPTVKPDPSGDVPVIYVKSTGMTMVNDGNNSRQLLVTVKLIDEKQNPVAGVEVTSEVLERYTGPLGSAIGKTNEQGEAQFTLTGFRCGRYIARIKQVKAENFSTEFGQPEAEVDLGQN